MWTFNYHPPTLHGQSWTFESPPTYLILSTWFVNDLCCEMIISCSLASLIFQKCFVVINNTFLTVFLVDSSVFSVEKTKKTHQYDVKAFQAKEDENRELKQVIIPIGKTIF